ncbi:DUF3987 domain-containing protein [Desulfovibrio sp. TomC]|uniref:DUF3987 domain-containing protein n=1 Tax=Desulfovibrio sp. TomC TaxID=1562888 RepID=UPI000574CB18|nr:DUF3987 domain-containing protein [Desulfovibrio sp. TomC]KHK00311.1 hypothetical protein NY78_4262 [Desulfovibrio sp. TomC]
MTANAIKTPAEHAEDVKKELVPKDIELDIENFPPVIKSYIEALTEESGCQVVSATINTLSLMSSVLQKSLHIPKIASNGKKEGYFQELYPNLWIVEVNKSGNFKTTTQNNAHEVAYKIESITSDAAVQLNKLASIIIKKYKAGNLFNRQELNELCLAKLPGNLSDYAELLSIRAEKKLDDDFKKAIDSVGTLALNEINSQGLSLDDCFYKIPVHLIDRSIFIPARITLEALLDYIAFKGGGLILSSEFSTWLAFVAGGGRGLQARATLTDLYDVPKRYAYSTKTDGTTALEKPFLSMCGAMTYSSFKELATSESIQSGFLARFLLFTPPPVETSIPAWPTAKDGKRIYDAKKEMFNLLMTAPVEKEYLLSEDAKEYYEGIHGELEEYVKKFSIDKSDLIEPFFRRWSPYILKIAMLMQYSEDPASTEINDKSIYNALQVVACAFMSTKWLIHEHISGTSFDDQVKVVLEYLANNKGERTWGELIASHKIKGGAKKYGAVLRHLKNEGRISISVVKGKKVNSVIKLI